MGNKKYLVSMVCLIAMALFSSAVWAGDLSPAAAPDDAASRMFTLEDIYQRLSTGANDSKASGSFAQPAADPTAGTMHSLDQVMAVAPAPDSANGATAADVQSGKTFWGLTDGEWGLRTGTMTVPAQDNTNGATAADVLSGTTFWGLTNGEWGLQTGTMTEGGDVTGPDGAISFTIPEGYYSGNTATATDANLLPDNIVQGVTIFGVAGNFNPGWNLHTTTSASALYGVDMVSSTDGWAVGWSGRIYHWDGTSWSLHTTFTYDIYDVEMLGSTDGWAVGPNCIYHWDGTSWSVDTTVSGVMFQAVSMVSSDDGWAVGGGGHIYRYSGGAWAEFTPSPTSSTLYDVDMVASDDGWMVNYNGYFYHWDGSSWSSGGTASAVLYCVEMLSTSEGWAGGSGGRFYHYSGGSWGLDTDISGYSDPVNDISMVSSTEGWAVGDSGSIFYYDGTTWSEYPVSMGSASIHGVDMLSSTDGAAVGGNGMIYDYDDAP